MSENTFTIKEASRILDCSTQNIYQQKSKLIQQGLLEKDNAGSYVLNEKAINFLREKRTETIKSNNQDFNQVANQNLSSIASPVFSNNAEIINILKQQIEDLKQEKEYWKSEYQKKDQELTKTNEHLQNMNATVFQRLLATEEQNKKQEEETKKGFFKKLFR